MHNIKSWNLKFKGNIRLTKSERQCFALFCLETDQCTGFKHSLPRKQGVTFMKTPAMARLQNILTYWWPTDPKVAQARLMMEFLVASNG